MATSFYRYYAVEYAVHDDDGELTAPKFPNPKIQLLEYMIFRETPKGYWISIGGQNFGKKWVSKSSKKRFAYPSKQEALHNFLLRTKRRIEILQWQITSAKIVLDKIESI